MPIYCWQKFHETNDFNWLVKTDDCKKVDVVEQLQLELAKLKHKHALKLKKGRNVRLKKKEIKKLNDLTKLSESFNEGWLKLLQDYIDRYGLDDRYREIMEKRKELLELQCDYIETKDRFLLNYIHIAEEELKELQDVEGADFSDVIMSISKWIGYKFDPKTHSVTEYKSAVNRMAEEARVSNKRNKEVEYDG